jgi:hypothetical protein
MLLVLLKAPLERADIGHLPQVIANSKLGAGGPLIGSQLCKPAIRKRARTGY